MVGMEKEATRTEEKSKFFLYYEKYMFIIGVLGQLLFYFQAHRIFKTQSAVDISLIGFGFSFLSVSSWLVYGLQLKNKVLIISNIFACIGAALVILGVFLYG